MDPMPSGDIRWIGRALFPVHWRRGAQNNVTHRPAVAPCLAKRAMDPMPSGDDCWIGRALVPAPRRRGAQNNVTHRQAAVPWLAE
jgi:hypothetical protein